MHKTDQFISAVQSVQGRQLRIRHQKSVVNGYLNTSEHYHLAPRFLELESRATQLWLRSDGFMRNHCEKLTRQIGELRSLFDDQFCLATPEGKEHPNQRFPYYPLDRRPAASTDLPNRDEALSLAVEFGKLQLLLRGRIDPKSWRALCLVNDAANQLFWSFPKVRFATEEELEQWALFIDSEKRYGVSDHARAI